MKRANTILAAAFLLVLCAMAGYTLSEFPTMRTETLKAWHARADQSEDYTIEFMVYADDELVYSSGPMDRGTKPIDFVVEIGECDLIRVQTRTKDYTSVGSNPGVYLFDAFVSAEEP